MSNEVLKLCFITIFLGLFLECDTICSSCEGLSQQQSNFYGKDGHSDGHVFDTKKQHKYSKL